MGSDQLLSLLPQNCVRYWFTNYYSTRSGPCQAQFGQKNLWQAILKPRETLNRYEVAAMLQPISDDKGKKLNPKPQRTDLKDARDGSIHTTGQ